ncbi:hypothetical protein ACJ5NV_19445 [Loktanella agnita]|uniref:hypothetical protein n=1 Tax=Loktanella agnita TaxID=287097 RepID=UPI00398A0528
MKELQRREMSKAQALFKVKKGTVRCSSSDLISRSFNACQLEMTRATRLALLCQDAGVQKPAFKVYMNKTLVKAQPMAHLNIAFRKQAPLHR